MKRVIIFLSAAFLLMVSCKNGGDGQLVGVQDRPEFADLEPYGMVYIPTGHYVMGGGDQDVPFALTQQSRNVTIAAIWMDETEITNNEYRQFVYWVRDSIAHTLLGDAEITEEEKYGHYQKYQKGENEGEIIEPKLINWKEKIPWDSENEEVQSALSPLFSKLNTRYYHYSQNRMNVSMLNYEYWWIDYRNYRNPKNPDEFGASAKEFDKEGNDLGGIYANRPSSMGNGWQRFIKHEVVNIYPDTLCWAHDFVYSYNEPMILNYFNNPQFDNYPVVGVSWRQAKAFSSWRTHLRQSWLSVCPPRLNGNGLPVVVTRSPPTRGAVPTPPTAMAAS